MTVGMRALIDDISREDLYISLHSDRRFSMVQEVKSIYAARATRRHRFGGFLTTPRGRDLFLLVLFFG